MTRLMNSGPKMWPWLYVCFNFFFVNRPIFPMSLPAHHSHTCPNHTGSLTVQSCAPFVLLVLFGLAGARGLASNMWPPLNCPVTAHWLLIFLLTFTRSCDHICSLQCKFSCFHSSQLSCLEVKHSKNGVLYSDLRSWTGMEVWIHETYVLLITEFAKQSSAVLAMYWLCDGV